MKTHSASFSRRRFIAAAGAAALTTKLAAAPRTLDGASGFVFAASPGEIRVYSTQSTAWTHIQTLPSEAPASLAIDSSTHTLHILHNVAEYKNLPCGYLESFRIDNRTGYLTQLSQQPLSLSAIYPGHMAFSPEENAIAVAVGGGATYNLLPILDDGRAGRPFAIRKETGSNEAFASKPSQVIFSPDGDRLFALDQGKATLTLFSVQPGLPALFRLPLPEGRRFSNFALHADANLLFAVDSGVGSLCIVQHNPANASLSLKAQVIREGFLGPLVIHAPSRTLFVAAANVIHAFRIQSETGELQPLRKFSLPPQCTEVRDLTLNRQNDTLYAVTERGIWHSIIDSQGRNLSPFAFGAPSAHSIALL